MFSRGARTIAREFRDGEPPGPLSCRKSGWLAWPTAACCAPSLSLRGDQDAFVSPDGHYFGPPGIEKPTRRWRDWGRTRPTGSTWVGRTRTPSMGTSSTA